MLHADKVLVVCEDSAGILVGACLGTARPDTYFRFLLALATASIAGACGDSGSPADTQLAMAMRPAGGCRAK